MKHFLALFYCVSSYMCLNAQSQQDSVLLRRDSLAPSRPVTPAVQRPPANLSSPPASDSANVHYIDSFAAIDSAYFDQKKIKEFLNVLRDHPYYNFLGRSILIKMVPKTQTDKDWLFYLLVTLILYFALINVFFGKYVSNLMALFFRVTMRQQQLREQILQTPLPSLLLNIFFVLSAGLYMAFLALYYRWVGNTGLLLLWLYSVLLLLVVYLGKFLVLKVLGWVFGVQTATDTYIFIVFLVNKVIGIFMIPVLLMLAFPHAAVFQVVVTLSISCLILLFIYRFFISYRPVRNEIKVNPFHFFIYLCAFEIAPLLLIYKVLLKLVDRGN